MFNAAGGGSTELLEVVNLVAELVGKPIELDWRDAQAGDVRRTGGSIERAQALVGWTPQVDLRTGLERQVAWHRQRRS
jgi:nucleoside-diphosphate-sugar epimerase